MQVHSASDLLEMGLLEKKTSINTEIVFLRNTTKRTNLFSAFGDHNKDDDYVAGVELARDNTPTSNGIRCNANVVLASVGAKIPAIGSGAATEIEPKLQFPKTSLAEWGNEFLTSAHVKYKGGDRILISEPSKMRIDRFFEYLPKKVHATTEAICAKFVEDNKPNHTRLPTGHVTIK